jgi:hypothetical protein
MLLLAAIAWGSTVEFTHHHGSSAKSVDSLSSTSQTAIAAEATSTCISSSKTGGASTKSETGAQCLICQLHQNLSTSEIGHTPGVGATEASRLKTPPSAVVQLSEFTSTGQGRAPPSIL